MHGNSAPASWAAALGARRRLEQDPHARYTLRRGNLIFKDVTEDGSEADENDEEEADGEDGEQDAEGEDGEEGAALSRGIREVRWSVPDGFTVAPEPSILDVSLVDSAVYICAGRRTAGRWARSQGWSRAARLVSSRNSTTRIVWADGSKGPAKLQVDNYGHGSHARYNSWVILTPATGE